MNDRQQSQSFKKLPRQQKVAVISLSIVAVGILGVWIWQFNSRINDPFRLSNQELAAGKKAAQEKIVADAANKIKDSDGDGITDYDETNVYNTSPYLEDTDGDGISDSEEIRLGKDPLCAEGTNCSIITNSSSSTAGTVASSNTTKNTVDGVDQALLTKALSGEGDANTMRQILLQGGGDPEQVNVLSDEELMTMYQEILKETKSTSTDSVASTTTNK